MTNKQMNGNLEQSFKDSSKKVNEFLAFINSKKLYLLDILKVRILKEKIAYANFYELYLSDSIVFEEIMNKKENFKTWFLKSGTKEIFVVDSDSVDDFLESQGTNKLIFIQEVNVNKVFEDPDVRAAAVDFYTLPAHCKAFRAEAIGFIAEAAKELFHQK